MGHASSAPGTDHELSPYVTDPVATRRDLAHLADYLQKISELGYTVYDARAWTPTSLAFLCLRLTPEQHTRLRARFEERPQSFIWFAPSEAPVGLLHARGPQDLVIGEDRRFPLHTVPAWKDRALLPDQAPPDLARQTVGLVVLSLPWDNENDIFWKTMVHYCQ